MTITNTIPQGWEFRSADFWHKTGIGKHQRHLGLVTLTCDQEGQKIWHSSHTETKDLDNCWLFASGYGNTLEEAIAAAVDVVKNTKPSDKWSPDTIYIKHV